MQEALEFNIDNHHKVVKVSKLMIHTTNINIINHNNIKQTVLTYTFMDLMKVLEYLLVKVFILIVKSMHLIINMLNHVGHELATSHYHIKYKAPYFQVIANLHVLPFQMQLRAKLADMNVVLVLVILATKLQLIYK